MARLWHNQPAGLLSKVIAKWRQPATKEAQRKSNAGMFASREVFSSLKSFGPCWHIDLMNDDCLYTRSTWIIILSFVKLKPYTITIHSLEQLRTHHPYLKSWRSAFNWLQRTGASKQGSDISTQTRGFPNLCMNFATNWPFCRGAKEWTRPELTLSKASLPLRTVIGLPRPFWACPPWTASLAKDTLATGITWSLCC